ncbi:MAG TPA: BlaI/MecI/CopY family transcriptional regulator [Lachnospiraceae bacterium]|jgi:predicted transcriptional regulator|nr:BlaI/MecI/CopY family transcriptional regulator [Eubacterium sp.]HBZ03542.1 BlaI/MecI/CopY family transcriptional regulator [Lachnospiraceae bacterium]
METPKVFESEYRFCLILWEHEPIKSTELAKLCEAELGWKKATTYTVIKRLSERNVIKSEKAVITSLVSKEEVQTAEIDDMVDRTFSGSIPDFLAAFSKSRKLSPKEISDIQRLIDEYKD